MADTSHPTYEVTDQSVAMEPDGRGNFVKMHTVHYRTASGTHSHVKLPHHVYTARNVHHQIMHEAVEIERTNGLPHTLTPEERATP